MTDDEDLAGTIGQLKTPLRAGALSDAEAFTRLNAIQADLTDHPGRATYYITQR